MNKITIQPLVAAKENPGTFFENMAIEYLQKQGLVLLRRNYRCRYGEIDAIMKHKKTLIFIEVRKRNSKDYGSPLETVTYHKQQKIIRSAYTYVKENPLYKAWPCRFDIIGVTLSAQDYHLEWCEHAYTES